MAACVLLKQRTAHTHFAWTQASRRMGLSVRAGTTLRSRGFDPWRAALGAAHQPAWTRSGGSTSPLRHHAGDDGGVVAIDPLQQAAATHRKIVMHLRRMQMKPVVVDDIDIALVARRDDAAIIKAD